VNVQCRSKANKDKRILDIAVQWSRLPRLYYYLSFSAAVEEDLKPRRMTEMGVFVKGEGREQKGPYTLKTKKADPFRVNGVDLNHDQPSSWSEVTVYLSTMNDLLFLETFHLCRIRYSRGDILEKQVAGSRNYFFRQKTSRCRYEIFLRWISDLFL